VATIPDAGGARYAPRGVVRALMRFAVLAGFVIAGWLLGSGTGHASEDSGRPNLGLVQLASDPGDIATPSGGGSDADFGVPPTVASSVQSVLSHASVPRLPVQPVDLVQPVVRAVSVPRPLAHVLAAASRPLSAPTRHRAGIRSQEPAHELAAVPPTAPAVRAAAATAPVTAPAPTTVPATTDHARAHAPGCAAAAPAAAPLATVLAGSGDPATPMPTSPPDSTTAPCVIGSTAGGGDTKNSTDLAVDEGRSTAGLASTHRLGQLSASDLPRSPAELPSASPD
jgi:hypothetical protein